MTYTRATSAPIPPRPVLPSVVRAPHPATLPPAGTTVAPPSTNSGFEAEQFVEAALTANGWTAHNVSRQQMGYDFLAKRGTTTRYIEVKSSLGLCSPALTSREWQQAKAHGSAYILSIIENFNSTGANTVFWVPDPANSCTARPSQTVNYAIVRSSWLGAAVTISGL